MTKLLKQSSFCRFLLAAICVLTGFAGMAQVTVKGKVTGENGKGLSDISVTSSSGAGTTTDSKGNFTFTIQKAGKYNITASGIGFFSDTKITENTDGNQEFNFVLKKDALGLDEVVVTGTGMPTKKRQLVSSVSTVSAKDFVNSGAQSIDAALQGKVAGAQINQNSGNPAGGINIRLRGVGSVAGSSDPLYIIDGVIVNNDSRALIDIGGGSQNRLVDLNMNDVERIEVIKGAAAAATYGSRASNGVVQIFTKKGKDGAPQFNFTTSIKSSSIRKKLEINEVGFRFNNLANTLVGNADVSTTPVAKRLDYQDLIFRNAIGTENNLSVSGGTANTKYYASLSNYYNQGIIKESDFGRNGLRVKLDQKIGTKMAFTIGANYVVSSSNDKPNGGIAADYGALTGFIFANNYIDPNKDPITGIYPNVTTNGIGVKRTNPLEVIDRFEFKQNTNRMITNFGVNYKPINGLNIDLTTGFDNYTQTATAFIPPNNTTNTNNTGLSRRSDATVFQTNTDLNIGYNFDVTSWLKSSTTIGGTIQYDKTISFAANADGLGLFGQTINNGTIVAGESRLERSYQGIFAQQTFDIANKIFINVAGRLDGSSVFSKDYSSIFYPKIGANYILSNEKFWSKISNVVSFFKIRSAWGKSGNLTAIGAFDRFSNYTPNLYGTQVGYIPSTTRGNVFVRPEIQTEFEFGVDASFLKDRLSVEFNYYDKKVQDLILNRTLAPTTGFNSSPLNVGDLQNKGIELLLRGTPIKSKNVEWVTSISYLSNKNVVSNVGGNGTLTSGAGFGLVGAVNGEQLGVHYASFLARNPDGSLLLSPLGLPQRELGTQLNDGTYIVGRNTTTGQPQGGGLVKVIGRPLPKHVISFINVINVKNFTFKMQWDGQYGFDVFNFTARTGTRADYGGLKAYEKELRGEVPKGSSIANAGVFENWIEKGDFTKLRELSLTYNLPAKFWKFRNASITISGRNLFAITPYSGYDPEINTAGQDNIVRGFDFVEVPLPRAFSLTFNLGF
jgi:TonB-dependent starch-binding outer membrane protein SusC